jgi:hypothetical protein
MKVKLWQCTRICFFISQIIANSLICSIGAWQLSSLAGLPIDKYLIFLGAFGLAFVFTLIFIELALQNPITSRLWFEFLWVGLFFAMEFAGAVAFSTKFPVICSSTAGVDPCRSARPLLAFSWICTAILAGYLILLAFPTYQCHRSNSRIWQYPVKKFRWSDPKKCLFSAPSSPIIPPTFNQDNFVVAAPVARRLQDPERYAHRFGLGSDYEIEHYRPPSHFGANKGEPRSSSPTPPVPPLPKAQNCCLPKSTPTAMAPPPVSQIFTDNAASLYPRHVQAVIPVNIPPPPPLPSPVPTQLLQPVRSDPTQPVLGDWPRPDAMSAPRVSHQARDERPPEGASPEQHIPPQQQQPSEVGPRHAHSSSRNRPSGPRRRSTSSGGSMGYRLPVLDLAHISAFKDPNM